MLLSMTSKQLIDEVHVRINKNRAKKRQEEARAKQIERATSKPYPKRDKSQVRIKPTKR